MMNKKVLPVLFVLLFLILAASVNSQEIGLVDKFKQSHQVGMRLGAWSNLGDLPPKTLFSSDGNSRLDTKINDANFYFEGFFGYRMNEQLMLELSMGISNRGSVTLSQYGSTEVGSVIIYPVLVQMKLYLLSMTNLRVQPYVTAGGGLYYGHRSSQVSSSGYVFSNSTESKTNFHYAFSGGFDWPLSHSLALDMNVKYMPITFSKSFLAINDYRGIGITVGIKYLYSFKKGDHKR